MEQREHKILEAKNIAYFKNEQNSITSNIRQFDEVPNFSYVDYLIYKR